MALVQILPFLAVLVALGVAVVHGAFSQILPYGHRQSFLLCFQYLLVNCWMAYRERWRLVGNKTRRHDGVAEKQ